MFFDHNSCTLKLYRTTIDLLDHAFFGETGTGKTMFAECMYRFAITAQVLTKDAPFITFNCADYAFFGQLIEIPTDISPIDLQFIRQFFCGKFIMVFS